MAKKPSIWEKIGGGSFLIGFVVAVIFGLFAYKTSTSIGILLVLGLIVGLLNITDREIVPFLIACIALILAGLVIGIVGSVMLTDILGNIVVFVIPGAVIASLKAIYSIASTK